MKSFKLIRNSKAPTSEWRTKDFKLNGYVKGVNLGVPTGIVNDIIVVDLDFYSKKDKVFDTTKSLFINTFKKEYENYFNTYAVKTGRGGLHLYFKFDQDIKQTACAKHNIDIRSNGGYVVAPKSRVDGKKYKIINKKKIKKIPDHLKKWLLLNIYKQKRKITEDPSDIDYVNVVHNYNFKEIEIKIIFNKLPSLYWDGYKNFLIFTTAAKILNQKKLWDEINKTHTGYNRRNNLKIWNCAKVKYTYTIDHIINSIDETEDTKINYLSYFKYKPIIKNKRNPDKVIDLPKLGYDFFDNKNYIIKSSTGSGKTTSVKHYIKNNNLNYISIVSRISLGREQHSTFNEHGINSYFYQDKQRFNTGENIIITIDSINKLYNIDFTKYVLFLDEFSSIIKYLISSSTLNKTRTLIYKLFIKIINECKQLICVDADINDLSLRFIEFTNKRNSKYIVNTFLHNKDVKAEEIFSFEIFINKLKNESKFLCCVDSKKQAKVIKKALEDENIVIITGDTKVHIDLDNHDKIIYSPKIIYGLDSSMERPVYCYYKEHTISPISMLQQISRCRNITKLNFLFSKKIFCYNPDTIEDMENYVKDWDVKGNKQFQILCDPIINNQYLELLTISEYNDDCYKTNMFSQFLKLLDDRGFIRDSIFKKTSKKGIKKHEYGVVDEDIAKFIKDIKDGGTEEIKQINSILKIPQERLHRFWYLFVDQHKLDQHFNLCNFIYNDENKILNSMDELEDFNCIKAKSTKAKIIYLKKIRKALKLEDNEIHVKEILGDDVRSEYFKEYNTIFRNRSKKNFDTIEHQQQHLVKMYDNIFGRNLIIKKQKTVNKIKTNTYTLDIIQIMVTEELYEYRHTKTEIIDLFEDDSDCYLD